MEVRASCPPVLDTKELRRLCRPARKPEDWRRGVTPPLLGPAVAGVRAVVQVVVAPESAGMGELLAGVPPRRWRGVMTRCLRVVSTAPTAEGRVPAVDKPGRKGNSAVSRRRGKLLKEGRQQVGTGAQGC